MSARCDVFQEIASKAPVVPVLVIEDPADAAPLAKAFAAGGVLAVEVTLRTPAALECVGLMKQACPELLVGVGTVLTQDDLQACEQVHADFVVTPGVSRELAKALLKTDIPACPGICTPGEAIELLGLGFEYQKFFPAEAYGGVKTLKAMSGPLRQISFMPTGGVSQANMAEYLKLPCVFAIGGSWLVSPKDMQDGRFDLVADRTKSALAEAQLASRVND